MYKDAIKNITVKNRIDEVRSAKTYTKFADLDKHYINAVVAIEDNRFYEHGVFDVRSIFRAILTNIKEMSLSEGGSTITQQVAKNVFFTQDKDFSRKIAEIFMGYDLEKLYTKDEILELYVNTSYFGNGYYNIKEAANGYYNKEPNELTFNEATILAGVPNSPNKFAPSRESEQTKNRQNLVIHQMIKYKYLTEDEAKKLIESK